MSVISWRDFPADLVFLSTCMHLAHLNVFFLLPWHFPSSSLRRFGLPHLSLFYIQEFRISGGRRTLLHSFGFDS